MNRRLTRLAVTSLFALGFTVAGPSAFADEALAPVGGYPTLVALDAGDTGVTVARLQHALTRLGMYHGPISGEYEEQTGFAVRTFHAYIGLEATHEFAALDWIRLEVVPDDPGIPDRWWEPDRVEVDIGRQLLFVVRDGEIAGILPISSGGDYIYPSPLFGRDKLAWTPRGDFTLYWHQLGWSCDGDVCVYKYWGFTPYYGIHGYPEVPNYPASHGCIRITTWDSRWVEPLLFVGIPIHIWDTPPDLPTNPALYLDAIRAILR